MAGRARHPVPLAARILAPRARHVTSLRGALTLAAPHGMRRKFACSQTQKARIALDDGFLSAMPDHEVLSEGRMERKSRSPSGCTAASGPTWPVKHGS